MITSEVFVSYAQNCEDVMLWRALRNVEQGCYVDVGAAEPITESVTYAFYLRGWRGINVEPAAGPFARLCAERPRDINLNYAIGDHDGTAPFFLIDGGNGLSTAVEEQVEKLRSQGWQDVKTYVKMRRLSTIIDHHISGPVHFLKVDVEGSERAVLESADLQNFRPWIIIIEATEPNSTKPTHHLWESLLTDAKYSFVWFDGLNRFYVAAERPEIAAAFSAPPNVFDGYIRQNEANAVDQLSKLRTTLEAEVTHILADRDGLAAALDELLKVQSDLEAKVNRLSVEKHDLAAALDQLSKVRGDLEADVVQLSAERDSRAAALKQLSKIRAELELEVARVSNERDGWAQELFETNRYAAYVTEQRQRFVDENRALVIEQVKLKEDNASLRREEISLRQENDALRREEALLRPENEALRRQEGLLRPENEALRLEEAALRQSVAALLSSTSWRISWPVRVAARMLGRR